MRVLLIAALSAVLSAQSVEVRPASAFATPAPVDSNSPAFWRDGRLVWFHSTGTPLRSRGTSQFINQTTTWISVDTLAHMPMWIEATWYDKDADLLYAWYHHETHGLCPGLAVPSIGALVSDNGGRHFRDLGIVLSSKEAPDCTMKNGFFAGGHGDFSVIPNRNGDYFYFLFDSYGGPVQSQGVALARMAFADRDDPAGKVWKYHDGDWLEPGLGGAVTPVIRTKVGWEASNTDSFWGPSVHWNSHLEKYVILMTRTCCEPGWPGAGTYIAFTDFIGVPEYYGEPKLLLRETGFNPAWYPQVMGIHEGETDTVAGKVARLWIKGISMWELVFRRADE